MVIIDWELPLLNGSEFVRIVRSPGVFPVPDIPIIMLSSHGERSRVIEAARIGVNEYLRKPISAQSLYDRLVSILVKPRPVVQLGGYYGPKPRARRRAAASPRPGRKSVTLRHRAVGYPRARNSVRRLTPTALR